MCYIRCTSQLDLTSGGIALKSLRSLSDNNLLNRLNKLVKNEHDLTLEILLHLIEVEDRKIYRSLGYSSMFVYGHTNN